MFESYISKIEILTHPTFSVYIERENTVTTPNGQTIMLPPWRTSIDLTNPSLVQQITRDGAVLSPDTIRLIDEVLTPILKLVPHKEDISSDM